MEKPLSKTYQVTLRFQFPAWDEKDGYQFTTSASNKSEAIRKVKKETEGVWRHAKQGRVTFKAIEGEAMPSKR